MPLAQSIGLDTLSKYFHLPINDVAKELGVCATVLKKICRKNGIPRWPHRKIKSLDKMIATLDASVAKNPEDEERIRQEILTLKNKRTFLMKNPNVLATKPSKKASKAQSKRAKDGSSNAYNACSFELLSPSTKHSGEELTPMASALYSQISHPHIPQLVPASHSDRIQPEKVANSVCLWNDYGDHKSAFVSPKTLRLKQQLLQQHYDTMVDVVAQYPSSPQAPVPPSLSPNPDTQGQAYDEVHAVPHIAPIAFSIQLPELRIPDSDEKPKLSTLEPNMFPHISTSASPSSPNKDLPSPTQHSKWILPQWFEDEHKHIMTQQQEKSSEISQESTLYDKEERSNQEQLQDQERPLISDKESAPPKNNQELEVPAS